MTNLEQIDHVAYTTFEGWLDGEGKGPSFSALFKARKWCSWLPRGYVYPTADAGLYYEYDTKRWTISIHFNANGLVDIMMAQVRV